MEAYSKKNKLPNKIGIYNNGGIGEWLLLSPTLQEIKRHSPKTKIYIQGNHKTMRHLLQREKNIDGFSISPDFSILKNHFRYDDYIILSNFFGFIRFTNCKQHWTNLAFKIFNLERSKLKADINLNQNDEKFGRSYAKALKNRMIILCNDTSDILKSWEVKYWERVVKECANYVFVQVGLRSAMPINGALNMLGKTTLTQAMSLVKYSKLVVTVDGLFNHVANAFNIPKVVLWSNINPRNFAYYNNTINIWKKINCSPCANLTLIPEPSCREFYVNRKVPRCMLAIKESEVINAIKKMLKEKHDPNIEYYKLKPVDRSACLGCKHKDICNIDSFRVTICHLAILQYLL
jgi:ADP-heptose:LPS heptosyltransferase